MSRTKVISAAVASFGLMGFVAATQADTVIDPSTTTYKYTGNPTINIAGSPAVQTAVENALKTSFGAGTLNDGLIGNQAYLDGSVGSLGNGGPPRPAYQMEGFAGQTGANGVANTTSQANNMSIYYSTNMTAVFNLGASYTNLSTVTIYGDWDATTNWSQFRNISITDGVHTAVTATQDTGPSNLSTDIPGNTSNTPGSTPNGQFAAQGYYFADTINISSLSGQLITLTFTNFSNSFAPINEIQFATSAVPEPASLGLLGIGGLALLRRRAKRRAL